MAKKLIMQEQIVQAFQCNDDGQLLFQGTRLLNDDQSVALNDIALSAITDDITTLQNSIPTRLVPSNGSAGQVLTKANNNVGGPETYNWAAQVPVPATIVGLTQGSVTVGNNDFVMLADIGTRTWRITVMVKQISAGLTVNPKLLWKDALNQNAVLDLGTFTQTGNVNGWVTCTAVIKGFPGNAVTLRLIYTGGGSTNGNAYVEQLS